MEPSMNSQQYVWHRAKGTKTSEWCMPGTCGCPWSITVFLNKGRAHWRVYGMGFSKPVLKGTSGDIAKAKVESVVALDKHRNDILAAVRKEVHPVHLVAFACKKLGITEAALKTEYVADREKTEIDRIERLARALIQAHPEVTRKLLRAIGVEVADDCDLDPLLPKVMAAISIHGDP